MACFRLRILPTDMLCLKPSPMMETFGLSLKFLVSMQLFLTYAKELFKGNLDSLK